MTRTSPEAALGCEVLSRFVLVTATSAREHHRVELPEDPHANLLAGHAAQEDIRLPPHLGEQVGRALATSPGPVVNTATRIVPGGGLAGGMHAGVTRAATMFNSRSSVKMASRCARTPRRWQGVLLPSPGQDAADLPFPGICQAPKQCGVSIEARPYSPLMRK